MQPIFADVATLLGVVLIDLVLAADNAVAVGIAASNLPPEQRGRAVLIGIGAALVLRIAFALIAVQLLQYPGLLLVGGLLLFWVAYRMWKDVAAAHLDETSGAEDATKAPSSFLRALTSIVIADVSMSLDNVLSVAGIARDKPVILAFGLVFAVVLMGVAAHVIARIIHRYRWIAYVGIALIVLVGIRMIWEDLHGFFPAAVPAVPYFFEPPQPPA